MSEIQASQAMYSTEQARRYLGGISREAFDRIAGEYAIRIGNSNYYKPEDLLQARESLKYGRQQ